ncbi:MAG: EAL domain-containing protein, partial [Acidimicrobiales bacterium]
GDTTGFEALLRWNSPTLGSVGPSEFIPIAERSGEINRIGQWVLHDVCRQISTWGEEQKYEDLSVSCNVSPVQLTQDRFVESVLHALDYWNVSPNRLVVEVTESAVLDHQGLAVQRLAELRQAGLRVSIDDFGSGYSNLGQLLHVPFDIIKIDRSLLLTLTTMREAQGGDSADPCAIMEAIVSIASVFKAPVICEGVETEEQRDSLLASGITHLQGYLTGRPTPPEDLEPTTASANAHQLTS